MLKGSNHTLHFSATTSDQRFFKCSRCDQQFNKVYEALKHEWIQHDNRVQSTDDEADVECYNCPMNKCNYNFENIFDLMSHIRQCKRRMPLDKKCKICDCYCGNKKIFMRHIEKCLSQHGGAVINRLPKLPINSPFKLSRRAFRSFLQQYELYPNEEIQDVIEFLTLYSDDIKDLFNRLIIKIQAFKVQFCLACTFRKEVNEIVTYTLGYFVSENFIITQSRNIDEIIENVREEFDEKIAVFESRGSGWALDDCDRLDLRIGVYNPLGGGCHIDLPKQLKNKHAIINIESKDNKCFLWSVCAALYSTSNHPERAEQYYKYEKLIYTDGIEFPTKLNKIDKFELKNEKLDIAINVYSYDKNNISISLVNPLRISKNYNAKNIVNLLLFDGHYFWIKNLNRLIGNFASINHHFCHACFASFDRKSRLIKHKEICQKYKPSIAILPKEEDKKLYFWQYEKQMKFPYVCYADFECILKKSDSYISKKSKIYQTHEPISYCLVCIKNDSEIFHFNYERGKDVMKNFYKELKNLEKQILNKINDIKPMKNLTHEQFDNFINSDVCHICNKPFNLEPNEQGIIEMKVRDHCHMSGDFRGAAHPTCNLNYQIPKNIPLIIHNSKGYDSHFIIKYLNDKVFKKCDLIPKNSEQILSFSLDNITFLDSYQFMKESLAKMVNNLRDGDYEFPITSNLYKDEIQINPNIKNLILKKGSFPYDFFDNENKFNLKHLPSRNQFYSSLSQENISDEDYEHAKNIWKAFNMKNFGDYHDLYLILDTILLADCFQNFRKIIHKEYGLEPCHFYSIPMLAWNACLKISDVKLDLITDVDMYNFLQEGIRGGMSCVNIRHAKANNKYMKNYDANKESVYLGYHDCNNLYGFSMNQSLPMSDFSWIDELEYENIDWENMPTNDETGYILEVDLEYPDNLHDLHNDFPLGPEKMKISNQNLSEYQKNLLEYLKNFGYRRAPTEKLLTTFYDKDKYTIHFLNLKLYLKLGMKLKKVHKVLKFKQSKYLKKYIKLNSDLRKNSKNEFEKDFFKLMNNSIFGKSIQNQRKQINMKLCLNEKQTRKWLIKPNYHTFTILDENKALIQLNKQKVKLNRPLYLGFACLEFAKYWMYNSYYNWYKKFYGEKIRLAYTDTDSFLIVVQTDDFYSDLKQNFSHIMDFSNYPKNHSLYSKKNEKVIGKFKDEFPGMVIEEFIGLKPKLYSILYNEGKFKNTAKGLQTAAIKKNINHDHYRNCLFENKVYNTIIRRIQSKEHQLTTVQTQKQVFQPLDDKRYYLEDGIYSIPFGHYSINQLHNQIV